MTEKDKFADNETVTNISFKETLESIEITKKENVTSISCRETLESTEHSTKENYNNQSEDVIGTLFISCDSVSDDDSQLNILLQERCDEGPKSRSRTTIVREIEEEDKNTPKTYFRNKHGRFCRKNQIERSLNLINYNKRLAAQRLSEKAIASFDIQETRMDGEKNVPSLQNDTTELEDGKDIPVDCKFCEGFHPIKTCPILFPKLRVKDSSSCKDSNILSLKTLPSKFAISMNSRTDYFGVYATESILQSTQFGPVIGDAIEFESLSPIMDFTHIWITSWKENENDQTYLTTKDEMTSNWCRYLRPSVNLEECNVISYILNKQVYFSSRRNISAGEEIVIYFLFLERPPNQNIIFEQRYMEATQAFCSKCQHQFENFVNFAKHIKIFHPKCISKLKAQCKECKSIFISYKDLSAHCKVEHAGKGAFVCEDCGANFLTGIKLKYHRNLIHYQEGSYPCKKCKKSFSNPFRYKYHVRRCHSNKIYKCSNCEKEYASATSLCRHKKFHDNMYTLTCDRCGKSFRDMSNMKVHLLKHSRVKPFQCQELNCKLGLTTKQSLHKHYRNVHGYTAENIPKIFRNVPFTVEAYVANENP